jgi:hypothetical protein
MKKGARSVEKGHLPEDLARCLARVRERTEPEHEGEQVPPPLADQHDHYLYGVPKK